VVAFERWISLPGLPPSGQDFHTAEIRVIYGYYYHHLAVNITRQESHVKVFLTFHVFFADVQPEEVLLQ
jgi:hypothetical protein